MAAFSDFDRLTIAAIGYAQQQLSEGQAVLRLQRRFGQFGNDVLLAAYQRAFEAVGAGQEADSLQREADIGLAYGPDYNPEANVVVEATVRWSVDGAPDQEWQVRVEAKAGDSVQSIMDRIAAIADTRNAASGRGEQRVDTEVNFILAL